MDTNAEQQLDGQTSDERMVRVDGVDLCTKAFGSDVDPPVQLVAGTSCSMDWWPAPFCTSLAERGLFVIRFVRRDTGRSTHDQPGHPSYALPDLVSDAVGVLDAYDVAAAHWLGFSMGGWLAQLAALDHADRVASLVLVSTRPTGHGPADADLPEVSERLMATWESAGGARLGRPRRRLRVPRAGRARPCWPSVRGVGRARDPLFPPGNAQALAAEIPGACLRQMPSVRTLGGSATMIR